jgi:hypothetical protein
MKGVTTVDNKKLIKYIAHFAMGDGCLYQPKTTRYPYIRITHTEEHEEYIRWKHQILSEITSCSLKLIEQHKNAYGKKPLWEVRSKTHPIYQRVRNRLYIGNCRVIDPHYLKLMDWEALSILYQDDGGISWSNKRSTRTPIAALNMNRYSYGDLMLVKKTLRDKLGLEWNIQKAGHGIYKLALRTKDYETLVENLEPYIFESFKYKIRTVSSLNGDDETV